MSDFICEVDWDDCENASVSVDGEEDIIYFDAKEGRDGWYLTTVLDCNTAGFCDTIIQDDGPYDSRDAALSVHPAAFAAQTQTCVAAQN